MNIRRMIRKKRNDIERRGVTTVEFAFAAPALFIMIFICAEFARLMMLRDISHTAAYEAARSVIVEGATNEDAINMANAIVGRLGAKGVQIDINNGQEIEFKTKSVTVKISIPLNQNAIVFPSAYGDNAIESSITLSTERYAGYFNANDVN